MLKQSEIIEAQALIVALKQQSTLPTELQTEFHDIGRTLAADPAYINEAIQRCVDLVATHPSLQAAFQSECNSLHAKIGERSKGLPPQPIDPHLEYSPEIVNAVRDVCLSAGKELQQPVSLLDRLLGKKSKAS
jgi:hypothetical protein